MTPSPILLALRRNLLPGLGLWTVAIGLAACYFLIPAARPAFMRVQACRQKWGVAFSAVVALSCGGVLPVLVQQALGRIPAGAFRRHLLFAAVFWAWKGVEVDLFYRLQGWVFGNNPAPVTIALKVAADQFLYNPAWASWNQIVAYRWRDGGCTLRALSAAFRDPRDLFLCAVPRVLAATWLIWIPAVAAIYAMPPDLQIPLFNVVLCYWVLVLSFLTPRT